MASRAEIARLECCPACGMGHSVDGEKQREIRTVGWVQDAAHVLYGRDPPEGGEPAPAAPESGS